MVKIVHITSDEKFIDQTIEMFDNLEKEIQSVFYSLVKGDLKYIKNKRRITIFSDEEKLIQSINKKNFDIVFLHSRFISYNNILKLHPKLKLIWISWGFDIYNQLPYRFINPSPINISIYKKETLNYLRSSFPLKTIAKYFLKLEFIKNHKERTLFYKRIDFLSTVLPYESKYLTHFRKKYSIQKFDFLYKRKDFDTISKYVEKGENIIIGNSAAVTNNHLDILEAISRIDLQNKIIYIPLSYGGSTEYINRIKKKVESLNLTDKVIYLDKFIDYNEYVNILYTCKYAIYGNIRQQAMGNVDIMLKHNMTIYLYKDSIVYKELSNQVYRIMLIEDLMKNGIQSISESEILNNKKIFNNIICYNDYISQLKNNILEILDFEVN